MNTSTSAGGRLDQASQAVLRLSELGQNELGVISRCAAVGQLKRKLLSMGFIPGVEVQMLRNAPLGDPMEISLHNYLVTLRRSEAHFIEVDRP